MIIIKKGIKKEKFFDGAIIDEIIFDSIEEALEDFEKEFNNAKGAEYSYPDGAIKINFENDLQEKMEGKISYQEYEYCEKSWIDIEVKYYPIEVNLSL